ncbi:hypothetical protein EHP00_990 [Ecytonucleospora hepatopenaei]|uniref:Uncharacterized protein n=1 Tax=Ecytonucleospora hepatopenaei TaxID=646526 RepID=A0A1W0E635_9MICR|nr:hypothetical protein EHP00_990 [Ecytonucleospora hepatopenaei]
MDTENNFYRVFLEDELSLGIKNTRPYSHLYYNNSGTIRSNSSSVISTGIEKIVSEDKNAIFFILGESPEETNGYVETKPQIVGQDEKINVQQTNHFHVNKIYKKDDFLGRMVALSCFTGDFEIVDSINDTQRGMKGYGSTGLK